MLVAALTPFVASLLTNGASAVPNLPAALAQVEAVPFDRPAIDWHAAAPELVLLGWGALVTVIDIIGLEKVRRFMPPLTGIGFLLALIPVLTLWNDGADRIMFDGAYVVDQYSLVLKGLFLVAGYVVVLLSTNYMADGDYYDSEYYQLIAASILGMLIMTSARDLISIFVALELMSIPAYLMAAWRKRDLKSNEAGLKYMLMGVFASAIMLYGMSLLYGIAGDTRLEVIADAVGGDEAGAALTLAILFTIIGFGFKVSAVPFHTWAPDTYEGAPTPLTAFLAVASKAAGFVALVSIVIVAFPARADVVEPFIWVLAAATMTIGNLIAMRQTNIVRMLAYSGVAQAGYMLAPLAVFGSVPDSAREAIVTYLVIYAAMNLGAFAVVIATARKTGSSEISSFGGMLSYAPGLTAAMSIFLFSLAGIPPMGGWLAKWQVFSALLEPRTGAGVALAVVAAVNTVIAAFYYLNVAKQMWFMPAPDGDTSPIRIPAPLAVAVGITLVATMIAGVTGLVPDITNFVEAAAQP
ncbi:MAG: NADH-quinone oxidoreductase subunit N [Actinomycetia bacterium]|nr:NADH-quinone oxidoreductase subunit N [Actinomycetes bacterium]